MVCQVYQVMKAWKAQWVHKVTLDVMGQRDRRVTLELMDCREIADLRVYQVYPDPRATLEMDFMDLVLKVIQEIQGVRVLVVILAFQVDLDSPVLLALQGLGGPLEFQEVKDPKEVWETKVEIPPKVKREK